jgi:ElaB/YqjD/DUF883 family membrane-anchored ribosome-binding protein
VTLDRNDDIRLAEEDADQADLRAETTDTEQMTEEEAVETAEIRAEIEETRLEMGGTLNELGDRLDPGHLIGQAKENVREATIGRVEETAKGMSEMVIETIKSNPIPAAIAGAGLAMLWANRKSGNGHSDEYRYSSAYRTTSYGDQGQAGQGIGEKVGDTAATVGDTLSGAVGQVGQAAGQVGQNVGQTAGQVGGQLDRFMQSSPLAMAAIAAGAGAVIGGLLPETPQEQKMLGDASRQVASTVRDTVDEATIKAEETMDRAEEKVASNV